MTSHPAPALIRTFLVTGVLALAATGYSATAFAQSSGTERSATIKLPKEAVKELKAKRQEIRQLSGQLRAIEKKATAAHPNLQSKRKKYRDLVIENMKGKSFDPRAEMKRMRSLQAELQDSEALGTQQRRKKMQELQQRKQHFQMKQRQAMQTDEVKAARAALVKDITSAMKEQDPRFQEKVARLDRLEEEYRTLLRQVLKNPNGNADTSQGG